MQVWFRPREGSFGFILFGWWLHVKAPWKPALFSEREGFSRWKPLGGGWRYQFRRVKWSDE